MEGDPNRRSGYDDVRKKYIFRSFLYSGLITLAFALLVNGMMYYRLKKIDMIESLKSVE